MSLERPIGIVSIPCSQKPSSSLKFHTLMSAAGFNTGNLLFTNAVWKQVVGEKIHTGFHFDPKTLNNTLSALVIPAANWFSDHVDFQDLAARVEQLDIPVTMIGLGAQNRDYQSPLNVPEGTVRLIKAVAERSHSVSVRGRYTRDALARYGIHNVTVTGCPSLYQDFHPSPMQRLSAATFVPNAPVLIHSTRHSYASEAFATERSMHRSLFRLAYRSGSDLLLQSEPEEISTIIDAEDKPEICDGHKSLLIKIYKAQNWTDLQVYLRKHARVFFDPSHWASELQAYAFVAGTRLHATIMALNSGVPAVLISHDSRTREMCEFAGIPEFRPGPWPLTESAIRTAARKVDFGHYVATRAKNMNIYSTFLQENGLEPSASLID